MKTLLILGCGYVGRSVGLSELEKGNRVVAVTRNGEMAGRLRADGMLVHQGNVHDAGWHSIAEEVDWALNCVSAAEPNLEGYRRSYLDGNQSFLDWMSKIRYSGPAVYTGSVSVYPDSGGECVSERDARSHSGRSEIILESEALFLKSENTASKTVLRLGGIYGPGRSFLADRIKKAEGALPGFGDYYLNLIRLEDIVTAIGRVFRAGKCAGEVFNVVDDEPLLKQDLVAGLAEMMEVAIPEFDSSKTTQKGARRLDGARPANRRVSNEKLKTELGWCPQYANALIGMRSLVSS